MTRCGVGAMAKSNQRKIRSRPRRWVAAAVIVGTSALAAWGAWSRIGADPARIRQETEADLKAGRYEHAAAALARLSNLTARDYFVKAQVAKALRHPDEALAALATIPDDDPAAPQARLLAGQIELRRDRAQRAVAALLAAVALDPTLVQAHRTLVYIDGILLRRRELNEHFQALARLAPMNFHEVFSWCLTRNTVWEPQERARVLKRFVAADPDDPWSRTALAETLRQAGRRDEAANVLAGLPESDPDARFVPRPDRPRPGQRPGRRGNPRGGAGRSSRTGTAPRPVRPGAWQRECRRAAFPRRLRRPTGRPRHCLRPRHRAGLGWRPRRRRPIAPRRESLRHSGCALDPRGRPRQP